MDLNDKKHPMTQQMEGYVLRFSTVASVQHATFPKFNIESQKGFVGKFGMSQNFQGFPHFELLGEATLATQLSRFLVVVQVEFESLAEWWSVHRGRFSGRVVFYSPPPRGQATV